MAFRYRKTLYKFNVLECIDTDGKSQDAVCVQVRLKAFGRRERWCSQYDITQVP